MYVSVGFVFLPFRFLGMLLKFNLLNAFGVCLSVSLSSKKFIDFHKQFAVYGMLRNVMRMLTLSFRNNVK